MRQERYHKYSRRRAPAPQIATRCRRFVRGTNRACHTLQKVTRRPQTFAREPSNQPIGWNSENGQRLAAKNFATFVRRSRAPTDQLAKRRFTRVFPWLLGLHHPFMPAMLELNTSHNHLCDSTLRHARNCIDAGRPKSKIDLSKPQHVVSARALDTICGGTRRLLTTLFRVLGSSNPKSGVALSDRPLAGRSDSVCTNVHVTIGRMPVSLLRLGRMPRWPQQILTP